MARVDLKKTVYERSQFDRVVGSREFQTFTQPTVEEDVTVEEFFSLYEELYLTIPINGDTQSHEYLVRKSTELTGIRDTTEDIQPLLDEIANLRQQLLEARQEVLLEQIKTSSAGSEINNNLVNLLDKLNKQEVEPSTPDPVPTPTPAPIEENQPPEEEVIKDPPKPKNYNLSFIPTGNNTYNPQSVNVLEGIDSKTKLESISDPGKGITTVDRENGTITFTPDIGMSDEYVISYTLVDEFDQKAKGFIFINVQRIESSVKAGDDYMNIFFNKTTGKIEGAAINILENDEIEQNLQSIKIVKSPNPNFCNGVTAIGGLLRYTLNTNSLSRGIKNDTIKYQVTDVYGNTSTATVFVKITTEE